MKFVAGPAAIIVIVGGMAIYRWMQDDPPKPPPQFLDAELVATDEDETPTCFSLGVVLTANFALRHDLLPRWTAVSADKWRFQLDEIGGTGAEGAHAWFSYTFEKYGDQIFLDSVANSREDDPSVEAAMNELLRAPTEFKSTPVERCAKGGTGYKPPR